MRARAKVLAATAAAALLFGSCLGDPTGPALPTGGVALAPQFSDARSAELAHILVDVAAVRVRFTRPPTDALVLDTAVVFPAGQDSVALTFTLPLTSTPYDLRLAMANAAGDTVFRAGPVGVTPSAGGSGPTVSTPTLTYVGTGANATGVRFVAPPVAVNFGQTIPLVAEAFDAQSAVIANTPIAFELVTLADTLKARIPDRSVGSLVAGTQRGSVAVRAALLTGQTATTNIQVQPVANGIIAQSGNGQAGAAGLPLAQPLVARVRAADGLGVAGIPVTFAVLGGGGALGTLVDTTDANGDASTALTLGSLVGAQTVRASVPSIGAQVDFTATASPGPAARLRFTVEPSAVAVQATMAPAVRVTAEDVFGNTATGFTGSVAVALLSNPQAAVLGGTLARAAVAGVATFNDLSLTGLGTGLTLLATSAGLVSDTSATFDITVGAAARLAFSVEPSASAAGGAIAPPVVVRVTDANGVTVTSATDVVTVELLANPGGLGVLQGTASVAAVAGIATFTTLRIDQAAVGYTLRATSGALGADTSAAFDVAAGAATTLSLGAVPANVATGAPFTISVSARDVGGNVDGSFAGNVTLAIANNAGNGALSGTLTVGAVAGVATFNGLSIDSVGVGYTLQATAAGFAAATSAAFNVTAGPAARLVILDEPSAGTAGAAITPVVRVAIQDASGNLVTTATDVVNAALLANPGGLGVLQGPTNVAAVAGIASFSGLRIDQAAAGYTLRFTSGALSSDTSSVFTVAVSAATQLVFSVQPPLPVIQGVPFAVAVAARDAFGNPVPAYAGTVTLSIGTNPAAGTLFGTTNVAAVAGVATFTGMAIDNLGTGYTLTASAGGLSGTTSNAFDVGVTPGVNAWRNAAGGNWSSASNWSRGAVPTAADTVWIKQSGTYTVNVDVAVTLGRMEMGAPLGVQGLAIPGAVLTVADSAVLSPSASVALSGGTIAGTGQLVVGGAFVWTTGSLAGTGNTVAIAPTGTLTMSGATVRVLRGTTLEIGGQATWSGAFQMNSGVGAVLHVLPSGTLDLQADGNLTFNQGGAPTVVLNQGTITRSTSAGTMSIGVSFENDGLTGVNAGTLQLTGGSGNTSDGALAIASGAALTLSAGTQAFGPTSTVSGSGALNFSGATVNIAGAWAFAGQAAIPSSTVTFTSPTVSLAAVALSGGTLAAGAGTTITISTDLTWTTGSLSGAGGTVLVPVGATLTMPGTTTRTFRNTVLDIGGTATWGGPFQMNSGVGAVLHVLPSGTLDLQADGNLTFNQGGAATLLRNEGTIVRSTSTGTMVIGTFFENDGVTNVNTGTLQLAGGTGNTSDGALAIAAGAAVTFPGGTHDFGPTSSVSGTGSLTFSGAVVNIAAPWAFTGQTSFPSNVVTFTAPTVSLATVTLAGGTLAAGAGATITVANDLTWTAGSLNGTGGTIVVPVGGTLTMPGTTTRTFRSTVLEIGGTATWSGAFQMNTGVGAVLHVLPGGTLDLQADGNLTYNQGGAATLLLNEGTVTRSTSAGAMIVGSLFENDGVTTVNTGTLQLTGGTGNTADGALAVAAGAAVTFPGGTYAFGPTSTVSGAGSLTFNGAVVNVAAPWTFAGQVAFPANVVTFTAPTVSLETVALSGGTVAMGAGATLTVANDLTWTAGSLNGTGGTVVVPVGGTLTMPGTTTRTFRSTVLELGGTATWSGAFQMNSGVAAVLHVQPGGTLDLQADGNLTFNQGGAPTLLLNEGTIVRSTSTGTMVIGTSFENDGVTNVNAGTLQLSGGSGNTADGALSVAAGAAVTFPGGTYAFGPASSVSGAGALTFNGGIVNVAAPWTFAGPVALSTNVLTFTAPTVSLSTVALGGGTLAAGAGVTLTVANDLTWTAGSLNGTGGTVVVPVGGTLTMPGTTTRTLRSTVLEIGGTATWSGAFQMNSGVAAVLRVLPGGTLDLQADGNLTFNQGGAATLMQNQGTVTRSTSTGTMVVGVFYENDGVTNVSTGTLQLGGGSGNTTDGALTVSAGAAVAFPGGTYAFGPSSTFTGAGSMLINGATVSFAAPWTYTGDVTISAGTASVNGATASLSNLTLAGGTLSAATGTTLTVGSTFTWTSGTVSGVGGGVVSVPVGATLQMPGTVGRTLSNAILEIGGTGIVNGNFALSSGQGAVLRVLPTGILDLQSDAALNYNLGGVASQLQNQGTLLRSTSGNTCSIGMQFATTGSVNVNTGTLNLTGGGSLGGGVAVASGASLALSGGTYAQQPTLAATGPGFVTLSGGLVNGLASGDTARYEFLRVSGGTLTVPAGAAVRVANAFEWTSGTLNGGGTTFIPTGSNATFATTAGRTLSAHTLRVAGSAVWAEAFTMSTGTNAAIRILPSGSLIIAPPAATTATMAYNLGGGQSVLDIQGTLLMSSSGTFNTGASFNSSGSSSVTNGIVNLSGGGAVGGSIAVDTPAELRLTAGTFTLANGFQEVGFGRTVLAGGTMTSAAVTDTATFARLQLATGVVSPLGVIQSTDHLEWAGTAAITAGTVLTLDTLDITGVASRNFTTAVLETRGVTRWFANANVTGGSNARIRNMPGAAFEWSGPSAFNYSLGGGTPTFENRGSVTFVGGGPVTVDPFVVDTVGSGFQVQAGAQVDLSGGGRLGGPLTLPGLLQLQAGTLSLRNGTRANSGGTGGIFVLGGTLTADSTAADSVVIQDLSVSGGIIEHEGLVVVTSSLNWDGGTMRSNGVGLSGTTRLAPGATLAIFGAAGKSFSGGHLIDVRPGATLNQTGTGNISMGTGATIQDAGLVEVFGPGAFLYSLGGAIPDFRILAGGSLNTAATTPADFPFRMQLSGGAITVNNAIFNLTAGSNVDFRGNIQTEAGPLGLSAGTFTLTGSLFVDGTTIGGDLNVSGGNLVLGPNALVMTGDLAVSGGAVNSTDPASQMTVSGNASFTGGASSLTAGVIFLGGNLTQSAVAAAFNSTGTHRTVLNGTALQRVSFGTPGTNASSSHFGTLDIANTTAAGVQFDSRVFATVQLRTIGAAGGALRRVASSTGDSLWFAGVDADSLLFDNVPLRIGGTGTVTRFNAVQMQNLPVLAQQVVIARAAASFPVFNGWNFASAPDGAGGGRLVVLQNTSGTGTLQAIFNTNNIPVGTMVGPPALYTKLGVNPVLIWNDTTLP